MCAKARKSELGPGFGDQKWAGLAESQTELEEQGKEKRWASRSRRPKTLNVLQAMGTVNLREAPLAHWLIQVVIYLVPRQSTWHRTQHVCKETLTCGSRGSITEYSSLSCFTSYVVFLYITMKAKSRLLQYFFKIFFLLKSAFSVSQSSSQIFFSSSANIPSWFCPVL